MCSQRGGSPPSAAHRSHRGSPAPQVARDRLIDGAADWIEPSERAGLSIDAMISHVRDIERRVRNLRKAKAAQQGRQHGAKHTTSIGP